MPRGLVAVSIAVAIACPRPARADALAEARALAARLEYEPALALVDDALAHGDGTTAARTAALHLLAGSLAAGLERAELARQHFAIALAIAPSTQLPDGTSPKLLAPFEAARVDGRALAPRVTRTRAALAVATDPGRDPLHLVVGVAAIRRGAPARIDRAVPRVALEDADAIERVDVLDAAGNVVWSGGAPPAPIVSVRTTEPDLAARWSTWAIVAAAAGVSGGALAWRTHVVQNEWNGLRADDGHHDYSVLQALESRGRRDAILADVAFGLAGAAAIASAIVYVVAGRAAPPVTLAPTRDGATLGFAGRF